MIKFFQYLLACFYLLENLDFYSFLISQIQLGFEHCVLKFIRPVGGQVLEFGAWNLKF